ncbi:hypothetical protein [Helicobacter sp.]|nr:hypothetical protein [Helicobacter sp.]MDY5556639.1 hypothetical protein [Helicobacter sp.]
MQTFKIAFVYGLLRHSLCSFLAMTEEGNTARFSRNDREGVSYEVSQ